MLVQVLTLCTLSLVVGGEICTRWCYPGNSCFPGIEDLVLFSKTLDGTIIYPTDEAYHKEVVMHNVYYTKFPAAMVFPSSTEDVRKSVIFARKHNLRITIRSSGHDFIGRSTGHGSLQINLSKMRKTQIDLNSTRNAAGTITIQSGAPWVQVYQEVDKVDRVVVGGSAHTVSQGGYTQGGGHSPICRPLGLAVDQVLEMTVVTADGRIVTTTANGTVMQNLDGSTTKTSDNDLFWALRGGGGGTYGIVTSYTYKLHYQPKQMVVATFSYLLSYDGNPAVGKTVMDFYNEFVKSMPKEWGGYVLMSNSPFPLPDNHFGTGALFVFNHFGEWILPSRKAIDQWETFQPAWRLSWSVRNVSSFWEYEQNATDPEYYSTYLMNTFVQSDKMDSYYSQFIADTMAGAVTDDSPLYTCTGAHIGGKVSDVDVNDSPVHPGFRSGLVSMSCSVAIDPARFHFAEQKGMEFYNKLKRFGKGVYVNEPSANLTDWKEQFWGPHYKRLLIIKEKWDPENIFTCLHCVGSDLPFDKTTEYPFYTSTVAESSSNNQNINASPCKTPLSVFLIIICIFVYIENIQ